MTSASVNPKIERGILVPTLPTLLRVALVFSVGLEHFFTDTARKPTLAVVKRADRQRFPEKMGVEDPAYHFESLDYPAVERAMNAYFVEFDGDRISEAHAHPGAEVLYVIEGRVTVMVGDVAHELAAGDSMYFDSSVPHQYQRAARKTCKAVVVTT